MFQWQPIEMMEFSPHHVIYVLREFSAERSEWIILVQVTYRQYDNIVKRACFLAAPVIIPMELANLCLLTVENLSLWANPMIETVNRLLRFIKAWPHSVLCVMPTDAYALKSHVKLANYSLSAVTSAVASLLPSD